MTLSVWQRTIVTESGDVMPDAEVEVFFAGSASKPDLFSDPGGATALTNPFNADTSGFARFYPASADDARYDVAVNGTRLWEDIPLGNTRGRDLGPAPENVPTNNDANARGFAQAVDSVSDLRTSTFPASLERLWLSGYYGAGTAGGGPLYRDSADTTTADNGETVFVDGDGVRWKTQEVAIEHVARGVLEQKSQAYSRSSIAPVMQSHGANRTIFAQQRIESFNGRQYCVFWHLGDATTDYLAVASRDLPSGEWFTYVFDGADGRPLVELANRDAHWVASLGIDDAGRILICYNTRNSAILWRYSTNPEDITDWSAEQTGMTGADEASAAYPAFIYGANRKLLFHYREGSSGNGDQHLNEWDSSTQSWEVKQHPLIKGSDTDPTTNPYLWNSPITDDGAIHLFFCWRETGGVATNHDLSYAVSYDSGATWEKSDGTAYALPIDKSSAEVVDPISQNSGLINQGTSAVKPDGTPVVSYLKFDGDGVTQIYVADRDGAAWRIRKISRRDIPYDLEGAGVVSPPVSRPGTLCFSDGTLCVITRDMEYGGGLVRYVDHGEYWSRQTVLAENLIGLETSWDLRRFAAEGVLDLLVAPLPGAEQGRVLRHRIPYDLVSFNAAQWALSQPPIEPMQLVLTQSAQDFSTTETTAWGMIESTRIAFSSASFPRYPQFIRWVVECENDTAGNRVNVGIRATRIVNETFDALYFAEKSTDNDARQILDSGWRRIPYFSERPLDYGFLRATARAPDGGTATIRTITLMLGSKHDESQSVYPSE